MSEQWFAINLTRGTFHIGPPNTPQITPYGKIDLLLYNTKMVSLTNQILIGLIKDLQLICKFYENGVLVKTINEKNVDEEFQKEIDKINSGSGTSGSGSSGNGESGFSGYSGLSGYSGYSGAGRIGTDGISGFSGYSGFSGFSGYSGTSGFSGYSGKSGFSGYSGISGTSGFSGYSGISGTSGFSGYSGPSGFSGYSGPSGFSGYSGPSGFSGYSGPSGFSGYSGISGFSGYSGISGFSGYSGISGFSGYSGLNILPLNNTFTGATNTFLSSGATTTLTVQAGSAQSSTNLLEVKNTIGTVVMRMVPTGYGGGAVYPGLNLPVDGSYIKTANSSIVEAGGGLSIVSDGNNPLNLQKTGTNGITAGVVIGTTNGRTNTSGTVNTAKIVSTFNQATGTGCINTDLLIARTQTSIGASPGTQRLISATVGGIEKWGLDNNGNMIMGSAALATNATDGFPYIPTCAGQPSGTPTAFTGRVPMIFDSTNNCLYLYDGGWISNSIIRSSGTITPSGSTATPNSNDYWQGNISYSSAGTLTIANETGTPVDGQKLIIRVKNTHAVSVLTISFGTVYITSTFSLSTIIAGYTTYYEFIYNSTSTAKWDLVALTENINHPA